MIYHTNISFFKGRIIATFMLLVLSWSISLHAQHPVVRNFPRNVYKGGTQNWNIAQNNNNEMFFANNNGLLTFDGYKWRTYPINNHTNVRSIYYDSISNRIYAGAFNELGYYACNAANHKLTYYSLKEKIAPQEQRFNEIWHIHRLDKSIYFQGDHEVFEYTGDTILRYDFEHKIDMSGVVENKLFIACQTDGVYALNGKMFIRIPNSNILLNKKICAIIPYKGKVLFVTDFHGIFCFDGECIIPQITGIDEFLKRNQIFCAATNGKKIVYGTVTGGIVIQEIESESYSYVNTNSGLQNNTILSIKFDKIGNIWLGLDNGIDHVLENSPIRELFDAQNNTYGAGYASFIKGETLYLGTNQGLYMTQYPIQNTPIPVRLKSCMKSQVWSLTEIDGTLFCGNDNGAYIIENGNVHLIPQSCGTWTFIELKQHPGCILGSSYQGLFILKKSGNRYYLSHYLDGFDQVSGMIAEDSDGNIWLSHWMNGIYRLQLNENADSIVDIKLYDHTQGFATKHNNTLKRMGDDMIFSAENGFFVYDRISETMLPHEKLNKLFGIQPYNTLRLYENAHGDLWGISGRFIGLAQRDTTGEMKLDSVSFRPLLNKLIIGFENINFVGNNMLISTEDGFSWIDTYRKMPQQTGCGVYLKELYSTNNNDSLLYSANDINKKQLRIPYKLNSLRFECAWPEYREDEAIRYSYKLENFDENWQVAQAAPACTYPMLPQGTYTFRVKAHNNYDNSESETSFTFEILAPWYSGTIAIIVYIIIFSVLIYLLSRYIQKRSLRVAHAIKIQKEREIEEQQRRYQAEAQEKEKEIVTLKNQQLEHDLRYKSQELSHATMNLIRKNETFMEMATQLNKIHESVNNQIPPEKIAKQISLLQRQIKENIEHDNDWHKFEENFDLVYENFLKRLSKAYPQLNINDKRLCAYLKMGLSSKEIAPLLNMSVRSVEMTRYRLRKKMELGREINLAVYLQQL